MADDDRHLLVDEALRGLHADPRIGLVVLDDEFEARGLAGDRDLLRAGVVERELHTVLQILAVARVDARERRGEADPHGRFVGGARGAGCAARECRGEGEGGQ